LITSPEFVVDLVAAAERVGHVHDEGVVARRPDLMVGGELRARWGVGGDELLDVAGLGELDLALLGLLDLDVEQVGDGPLVLDLPVGREALREGAVD
jgi:hypothetical protein